MEFKTVYIGLLEVSHPGTNQTHLLSFSKVSVSDAIHTISWETLLGVSRTSRCKGESSALHLAATH